MRSYGRNVATPTRTAHALELQWARAASFRGDCLNLLSGFRKSSSLFPKANHVTLTFLGRSIGFQGPLSISGLCVALAAHVKEEVTPGHIRKPSEGTERGFTKPKQNHMYLGFPSVEIAAAVAKDRVIMWEVVDGHCTPACGCHPWGRHRPPGGNEPTSPMLDRVTGRCLEGFWTRPRHFKTVLEKVRGLSKERAPNKSMIEFITGRTSGLGYNIFQVLKAPSAKE